jgi:hypothetical protein
MTHRPDYELIGQLSMKIFEQETKAAAQEKLIEKKDMEIATQKETIAERDWQISNLEVANNKQADEIMSLKHANAQVSGVNAVNRSQNVGAWGQGTGWFDKPTWFEHPAWTKQPAAVNPKVNTKDGEIAVQSDKIKDLGARIRELEVADDHLKLDKYDGGRRGWDEASAGWNAEDNKDWDVEDCRSCNDSRDWDGEGAHLIGEGGYVDERYRQYYGSDGTDQASKW